MKNRFLMSGTDERKVALDAADFSEENMSKPLAERTGLYAAAKDPLNPDVDARHALWCAPPPSPSTRSRPRSVAPPARKPPARRCPNLSASLPRPLRKQGQVGAQARDRRVTRGDPQVGRR